MGDRGKRAPDFPIMFDGRNDNGNCGIRGGTMLVTGTATDSFWLVDSSNIKVPMLPIQVQGHLLF